MKKAYIFLAEGFEEVEALTVVDILRRGGIDMKMVSISEELMVSGSHSIPVRADLTFAEGDFTDADLLILPGGMPGTKYLMVHKGLGDLLRAADEKQTLIGAICAAPTVLGALGILKGEEAVCYPGMEKQLKSETLGSGEVSVSHHLTTSRGVGTAIPFALKLLERLTDAKTAQDMAAAIVYQQ